MEILYSRNAVIAILLLVGQISTQIQPHEVEGMIEVIYGTCSVKYPITDEMKANVKKNILPDDRNFKCYMTCILDKYTLIDSEGVLDGNTWMKMAPGYAKDAVTKTVAACLPYYAGKPDVCEAIFSLLSCAMTVSPGLVEMLVFPRRSGINN